MKNKPLLSVCVPTFNRADYVEKCVNSFLHCDCNWFEVCVTDNASTDSTVERLSKIDDFRLRVFKNSYNICAENIIQCMKNANGYYCLLVADKDLLEYVNLDSVKEQLSKNLQSNIGLFRIDFKDSNGELLEDVPQNLLLPSEANTLTYILHHFCYMSGIVIKRDLIDIYWNKVKSGSDISALYPHRVLALKCATQSGCYRINDFSIKRQLCSNRFMDPKANCGKNNEPYWTASSRTLQINEWFDFFYNLEVKSETRIRLCQTVLIDSILVFKTYHYYINKNLKDSLFELSRESIERDKKKYRYRWIVSTIFMYLKFGHRFNSMFGCTHRDYKRELKVLITTFVYFVKNLV